MNAASAGAKDLHLVPSLLQGHLVPQLDLLPVTPSPSRAELYGIDGLSIHIHPKGT